MAWPPMIKIPKKGAGTQLPFQIPLTVFKANGAYVSGTWVESLEPVVGVTGNVQPATLRDYTFYQESVQTAARQDRLIRIYSETDLNVVDQKATPPVVGDIISYDNALYRLIRKAPWQSGVFSHYRYLAVLEPEGSQHV